MSNENQLHIEAINLMEKLINKYKLNDIYSHKPEAFQKEHTA